MIEYYSFYDMTTGAIKWKAQGPEGSAAVQKPPEGVGIIVMPYAAMVALPDLGPLKSAVIDQVNTGAGNFRKQFITDIPGQQATYLAKETEAKAWTTGGDAINFPYLSAEAAATRSTIDAVAALVLATAEQWRALDPKIEGQRRGATVAVNAAANIAEIVAAATVNWGALLAQAAPSPAADPATPPDTPAS